MPHLVNRKFGCFSPTTTLVNGAFAYNFDYLESTVGRRFDVFSTFLDLGADYPGNPSAPATRKQHSEIISTVVPHFHRPPSDITAWGWWRYTKGRWIAIEPAIQGDGDVEVVHFDEGGIDAS